MSIVNITITKILAIFITTIYEQNILLFLYHLKHLQPINRPGEGHPAGLLQGQEQQAGHEAAVVVGECEYAYTVYTYMIYEYVHDTYTIHTIQQLRAYAYSIQYIIVHILI